MDDTKVNWYATVHTPAAVTIHSENQQKARQHHKQQETTKTKQNTPKTSNVKVIGGPVQRLLMKVRWCIVSTQVLVRQK